MYHENMTSYGNYYGTLFSQFEQALQKVCIEREILILPMAWEGLVNEFYNNYLQHGFEIYQDEWDGHLDDDVEAEEILLNLRNTATTFDHKLSLLDHFMENEMNEFSVNINFTDPYECDDCGSLPINTVVNVSLNTDGYWDFSQSYGCYGGDSFYGSKEDCLKKISYNLTRLILTDTAFSKLDKKRVQKFISALEKFELIIPFKLPKH